MMREKMNFILFLFVIISVHHSTLARHTKRSYELQNYRRARSVTYEPIYRTSNDPATASGRELSALEEASTKTTIENAVSSNVGTTETSIVAEPNNTSTAVDLQKESGWSFSSIFASLTTTYNKVTSYTGPYLLPGLLIASVIGIVSVVVCTYTTVCDTTLSAVIYNANQARDYITELANPYLPLGKLNSLTDIVYNAIGKFSAAQKDGKID